MYLFVTNIQNFKTFWAVSICWTGEMCNLCCLWSPEMCHVVLQIPVNCNLKHSHWTHTFRTCLSKIPFSIILPPIPVTPRSKAWVCGRSLAGIVGSNPAGAWVSVSCECCVLSGRGLSSGWSHVHRSPTECGVSECHHESSTLKRPWPTGGCCTMIQ